MAHIATQRVKKEFNEVMKSDEAKNSMIHLELKDDNFKAFKGQILGPPETPYEGGTFTLDIQIPDTYPFNPPKVKFVSKIWHPNISSVTGAICLDILKDEWAAAMTLRTVLISLQALLAAPEPDDPQDAVVANQYRESRQMYKLTAQYWTATYAGGNACNNEYTRKITKLVEMGVTKVQALTALSTSNWDIDKCIESLFN